MAPLSESSVSENTSNAGEDERSTRHHQHSTSMSKHDPLVQTNPINTVEEDIRGNPRNSISKQPFTDHGHLQIPQSTDYRQPSLDTVVSDFSDFSAALRNDNPRLRTGIFPSTTPAAGSGSGRKQRKGCSGWWNDFWIRNKGVLQVLLAEFFSASMVGVTRKLEAERNGRKGMDPFQILFARQSITFICSMGYMWYMKTPDFPLGKPAVRPLLVLRGVGGFFGVFGLYQSVRWLPLSDAIVLTFLSPIFTCYACSLLMPNEVFSRVQQLSALVSLLGVVCIAQPIGLLSSDKNSANPDQSPPGSEITSHERFIAVVFGLIGALGATCAITTIRVIGTRAHPLISVNYFSAWCTIVSTVSFAFPGITFRLPADITEWTMLLILGLCGFTMQFLLTAGLSYRPEEKTANGDEETAASSTRPKASSSGTRATSMIYSQMLFALLFDKIFWNTTPNALSWLGSALILGGAIWIAISKDQDNSTAKPNHVSGATTTTYTISGGTDSDTQGQDLSNTVPDINAPRSSSSSGPSSQLTISSGVAQEERALMTADSDEDED